MAKIIIDRVASTISGITISRFTANPQVKPHGIITPGYQLVEVAKRFRTLHIPFCLADAQGERIGFQHPQYSVRNCMVWRSAGTEVFFMRDGRAIDFSWENLAWLLGDYAYDAKASQKYTFDIEATQQVFMDMKAYKRHTMMTFLTAEEMDELNLLGFSF